MSWDFAPAFDAAHRAALEGGKPLVYVCAPASWPVVHLFADLPDPGASGLGTLVLAPTTTDALDLAGALRPVSGSRGVHPLTGLVRGERLLRADAVGTLVGTPADVMYLLSRSALKSDRVSRVAVVWPEAMLDADGGGGAGALDDLDAILGDAPKAQRLIVTSEEASAAGVIERHARRAPVAVHSRLPDRRAGIVRYAAVEPYARVHAARVALDVLAPQTALVWDPSGPDRWQELVTCPDVDLATGPRDGRVDLVISADLPSAKALAALHELAREVLVLLRPRQIPYLERISETTKPVRLRGDTDQVRSDAAKLRERLRERLDRGSLTAELLAVESLLEEYDPALVAAAALTGTGAGAGARAGAGAGAGAVAEPPGPPVEEPSHGEATWTRLYVTAGRRDQVREGAVLKVVMEAANLKRSDVGRIDVKENFTLVEVRPEVAGHTIRCVTGCQIRGRRVTVRPDRQAPSRGSRAE